MYHVKGIKQKNEEVLQTRGKSVLLITPFKYLKLAEMIGNWHFPALFVSILPTKRIKNVPVHTLRPKRISSYYLGRFPTAMSGNDK